MFSLTLNFTVPHKGNVLRFFITRSLTLTVIFVCLLLAPKAASADPLTLTINPSSLTAPVGGTVSFIGTITNDTGLVLNATDLFINFSSFDPTIITATQLLGDPDFILANGGTSAVVNLFSVTLSPLAVPGSSYSITLFLQDPNNNLSNNVTVVVTAAPTAVPEPATLLLLGTGLAATAALRRKRRNTLQR